MRHHSHPDNDKSQLAGIAILAAAVGALTALIFAPKSGSDTRQQIRQQMANSKKDITTRLRASKAVVHDEAKSASETLSDAVAGGQEQIDAAVKSAKRTIRRPKTDNDDMTDDIRKNGEQ